MGGGYNKNSTFYIKEFKMPEKTRNVQPPCGIGRWFYRSPIPFYNLGLGWMMGQHFVCITHLGRKSGQKRQTVLEVIRHDKAARIYYVVSAYGEKSAWFQNIQIHPDVIIQVGSKKMQAAAVRLSKPEAEREILDYYHRNPKLLQTLVHVVGYKLENTEEDARALIDFIPIVALKVK